MSESARPDWATERLERAMTIAFVVIGMAFVAVAIYSTIGQLDTAVAAWDDPGEIGASRAVMAVLNREILAAFIGVVLFASGVLRWRE